MRPILPRGLGALWWLEMKIFVREPLGVVAAVVGYDGDILWDADRPDGMPRKLLDVSRIRSLGWEPSIDLPTGLANTYRWYLDQLDALPKGINYGGYVGHSALRMYVMGERALTDEAPSDAESAQMGDLAGLAGLFPLSTLQPLLLGLGRLLLPAVGLFSALVD